MSTHRLDGKWGHAVEFQGERWVIPAQVVDRMMAHRAAIITEDRRHRAQERVLAQAQAVVAQGQGV